MSETIIPNPGSLVAKNQGCKCSIIDNQHGRGVETSLTIRLQTGPMFFVADDCPIHKANIEPRL